MKGINDRTSLVTGAGSGIGRATAERFADEGANVLVADIDRDSGKDVVQKIKNRGGEAEFVEVDVSDPSSVESMVERAIETYETLDFAVNNVAAGVDPAPVTDITETDWDRVTDIAQKGVWLGLKHEVPAILNAGGGVIVNTASLAGIRGSPGRTPYSASKHGVIGLTRSVALEYAEHDLRVNAVCPTIVKTAALESMSPEETDQVTAGVPMGRAAEPEEVASAIVWFCSDDASFITGQSLAVDGGETQQ